MKVRSAIGDDADAFFNLVQLFPTPTPASLETFSNCYRARLADPYSYIGLAEMDDLLVGYISAYSHLAFYAGGRTAWVDEIFVDQAFRRKQIGAALLKAVEHWGKESDCVLVSLATAGAGPFYSHVGYKATASYYKKYL
jgi:GNAT superfamily N-acetyltransferase